MAYLIFGLIVCRTVVVGSGPFGRVAKALFGHSYGRVASCLQQCQHFIQVIRQDLARLPVAAPEPQVSADCVVQPSLAEFSIGADKDRLMLRGPYR
jgi:hypothetical protein